MESKTILFTVDGDSISPKTEQKAGVQGNHNITKVRFNVEETLVSGALGDSPTSRIRMQFINGAGGFYSTGFLDVMSEILPDESAQYYVTCPIPNNVTNAGGVAYVYLVVTEIEYEGKKALEKQAYISPPGKLFYTHSGVGSPSDCAYRVGISNALVNAEIFVGQAERYSNEAKNAESNSAKSESAAATSAANALISENNATKSAKNAQKSENNASTSADNAETSETNAGISATNASLSADAAEISATAAREASTLAEKYRDDAENLLADKEDKLPVITELRLDPTKTPIGYVRYKAGADFSITAIVSRDNETEETRYNTHYCISKGSIITVYHKSIPFSGKRRHKIIVTLDTTWNVDSGSYVCGILRYTAEVKSDGNFTDGNFIYETYATKEELGEVAESICRWKANTHYEVGDVIITKYGTVDRMFKCIVEHTSSAKLTENELDANWEEAFQAARAERDSEGNKISSTYLKQAVANNLLLQKTDAANIYAPLTIVPSFKITKIAPNESFSVKPNMLIMAMGEDAERCIELYGNNETKISSANMLLSFSVASNEAIEGDGYIASRVRIGCLYYESALSFGIKNYYIYKPIIKNTSSNNKSVYIYYVEQG